MPTAEYVAANTIRLGRYEWWRDSGLEGRMRDVCRGVMLDFTVGTERNRSVYEETRESPELAVWIVSCRETGYG